MIYLDNSATTFAAPEVVRAVAEYMRTSDFNPSSIHAGGVAAWSRLTDLRTGLAKMINSSHVPCEILFTSGGTESNNLALLGFADKLRKPATFLVSYAEHSSILNASEPLLRLGVETLMIPLDGDGRASLDFIRERVCGASLISVTQVASETGAVQPLSEIVKLRDELNPSCAIHCDGSQGFLRVSDAIPRGVDMYTISGHKIHAPKGVAVLAARRGIRLFPTSFGGGQEGGLRAGTENMPGIVGLCEAVRLPVWGGADALRRRKLDLYYKIMEAIPGSQANGADPASPDAAPHILNVSLPGVPGEVFARALAERGVYVGTGSACASRQTKHKAIYRAMGIPLERQKRAVRLSLSPYTTDAEIAEAAALFAETFNLLYRGNV